MEQTTPSTEDYPFREKSALCHGILFKHHLHRDLSIFRLLTCELSPGSYNQAPAMAELAALSLACNIFQVISFAHEIYDVCKGIRETGTSDVSTLVSTLLHPLFRPSHCLPNSNNT